MSRLIFTLIVIATFAIHPAQAKGKFDGTYVGDATAKIYGQKVSVPISLKVKGQIMTGKVLVPGSSNVVAISGAVNVAGHFLSYITLQFGVTGQLNGKITKSGNLTGNGAFFITGFGSLPFKVTASLQATQSSYRGTWVSVHPPNQAIIRVEVKVTPQGVASLAFHTNAGQTIVDNHQVSDDGQITGVVNGFVYFVRLYTNDAFTGTYQGVLGTGSFTGSRTSKGGTLKSIAGAYAAISNDPKQSSNKLRFIVSNDRSLVGSFEFRNGTTIPFTNIVGDDNDFTGTTAGGISYFAKIASDGTFTLSYQSAAYGSGSFAGKQK